MSWAHSFAHGQQPASATTLGNSSGQSVVSHEIPNEVPLEFLTDNINAKLRAEQAFQWTFPQPDMELPSQGPPLHQHHHSHPHSDTQHPPFTYTCFNDEFPTPVPRAVYEERVSSCLSTLRGMYRSLRAQHHEAQQYLAYTARRISHSSWYLFFQSPRDFVIREMDSMEVDIPEFRPLHVMSPGGVPPGESSQGRGALWTRDLAALRMLRDDERVATQKLDDIEKGMDRISKMTEFASREQQLLVWEGEPTTDPYKRAFDRSARRYYRPGEAVEPQPQQQSYTQHQHQHHNNNNIDAATTSISKTSRTAAQQSSTSSSSSPSTFLNWPLPAMPIKSEEDAGMADISIRHNIHGSCHHRLEEEHDEEYEEEEEAEVETEEESELEETSDDVSSTDESKVSCRVQAATEALLALSPQEMMVVLTAVEASHQGF